MRLCPKFVFWIVAFCPVSVLNVYRVVAPSKNAKLFHSAFSQSCTCIYFVATLLFSMSQARAQESIGVGGSCDSKSKPPAPPISCIEGSVVDCRTPANSQEQLYCSDNELRNADNELNHLYQRALKKFEMPANEYVDFKSARSALIESQRAWVNFEKFDCEIPGHLNLKGSIQSAEIVGCELKHTKNRITDLHNYVKS